MTIERAMILAAGFGKRLLPISEKLPKPLVPILNIPNILYSINFLKINGIKKIIINLYHLGNLIKEFLGNGEKWDIEISYSEEQILLGTGGGVKKAEKFLKNETFLLINCDFITNINLAPIVETHFKNDALATMVLYSNKLIDSFYSCVGVDEKNHICSLPKLTTRTPYKTGIFTGIHILNPSALKYLDETPMGINEVLYPALIKNEPKKVFGIFMVNSFWYDTGELDFYWSTTMSLLNQLEKRNSDVIVFLRAHNYYKETGKNIWIEMEKIPQNCTIIGPSVIGKNVIFGNGSKIGPYVVIGDNSIINDNVEISRSIVFNDSTVNINLENSIYFEKNLPVKTD